MQNNKKILKLLDATKIMHIFYACIKWSGVEGFGSNYVFLDLCPFLLQYNKIKTITDETFCKGNTSRYIRPNIYQVRLDGNPIVLSQYPNSFICMHSLPIGRYHWTNQSMLLPKLNITGKFSIKWMSTGHSYTDNKRVIYTIFTISFVRNSFIYSVKHTIQVSMFSTVNFSNLTGSE